MPAIALAALVEFMRKNWLATILLALLVVQTVRIEGIGIWPLKIPGLQDKYDTAIAKLVEARAELERISTKKNEQRDTTKGNVKQAETLRDKAEGEAEKIERAPTAKNCETPPEIMGADL